MKRTHKHRVALSLPSIRLEGGLFLPDQLERAALGQAQHQDESDYQLPPGLKLKDEIGRAFQIAAAQWRQFEDRLDRMDVRAGEITEQFVIELLRHAFGYQTLARVSGITVGERRYPITALTGPLPVVIAPHTAGLDEPREQFAVEGSGSRRKSAFQLAQECLNASPNHLWALVSNGRQIRLLRDAATLTRPSFLEIDLQDLLASQRYAEFAMAWRLLHASRATPKSADSETAATLWERWREAGNEEGTRVREGLRVGVADALITLGSGFLAHPDNQPLRQALQAGTLDKDAYFQQLLRLIYRLIFLFSVEERGLLHPSDHSPAAQRARQAYAEGYAMARLRETCLKRRARNAYDDLWQAARIVFKGLAKGEPRLALPALGGLFAATQCPALDAASLDNAHWLRALAALRWSQHDGNLAPVDYRNMGPEELGSVYESLLELVPELDLPWRAFGFVGLDADGSTAGNARKLSGSYYTPDSLVQELIRSALDPVIEQRLAEHRADPVAALLEIKVIDPACGSGHFLLAAARRLAERLAQLRTADGAVKPEDYRHALREVIARCIHGVDKNPMAIELARTALWLEGFEEGRPLGFLDHHLQCGDALLGVMDLQALELGIPKEAFKVLSGDDKAVCKLLNKANTEGLKQFARERDRRQISLALEGSDALAALSAIESMPEDDPKQIAAKEAAYRDHREQYQDNRLHQAADILLGAFLLPKVDDSGAIPTSKTLYLELRSDQHSENHRRQRDAAQQACAEAGVFHWPLRFPQVFARGGFDCVLGNPPWERIKLQEEEFFATRSPMVTEARNKAERTQRIDWLADGQLAANLYPDVAPSEQTSAAERRLYRDFLKARRTAEALSLFVHVKGDNGGRFPLTGVGDVNTYALFAETMDQLTGEAGRAGFIVPTGIATDDSTKAFFGQISQSARLVSLLDLENRERLFTDVDSRVKFCLLTLGAAKQSEFVFFATQTPQLTDPRRRFTLTPEEFRLINPNTLTCPVFRSERDAELTKKL
ncbi:Eco57I restriction-modification methylase domain-containing protein, partial [Thiohalocapsa marina]|uniref:Eco57I restriction-modification methylase domain-containing protein n=1 Tax=Thiohalocapsa marina TaxID=424902 RepID=UPI0036DBF0FA